MKQPRETDITCIQIVTVDRSDLLQKCVTISRDSNHLDIKRDEGFSCLGILVSCFNCATISSKI
jgi:hypothetical protein